MLNLINKSCECVRSMTNRSFTLPREQKKRSISYQVILLGVSLLFYALQFPMCFKSVFKCF